MKVKFKVNYSIILSLVLTAAFTSQNLFAQNQENRQVNLSLRALALAVFDNEPALFDRDDREDLTVHFRSAGVLRELRVPTENFSQQFQYQGDSPIQFVDRQINAEGVEVERVLAEVNIPAGMSRGLLLMISNPQNGSLGAILVDASNDRFPDNSVRVLNLTNSEIACGVGEHTMRLSPRGSETVTFFYDEPDTLIFRLARYDNDQNNWVQVYTTGIAFVPGRQQLILITPDMKIRDRINPSFYSMSSE